MKLLAVFILFFSFLPGNAQRIQTIAPKQPVVVGTAFQVQYIIPVPVDHSNIIPPSFDSFRVVSGPNYYKGNVMLNGKQQIIENITYTLVPTRTGILKIKGLKASFKNLPEEESAEVIVTVIPQPKVSFSARSSYTDVSLYAPSSITDQEKMINENIFIKTEVSRKFCFIGEAIVASFKLYSRLQSSSELIRTPALYGFSVMDILNLNESHQEIETINGKVFNTSTLRKVQLYPEQTGKLVIDEMIMQNEIEFDDTIQGRKSKIEKELRSTPVIITVKPLSGHKPENYTGAVGQFAISTHLENGIVAVNHQGKLTLTIHGKGNFIQFGQPNIQWPKGFDVFEPVITEKLNKMISPVEGSREYIFGFTADSTGIYRIPPVHFSFFDPESNSFKIARTDSLKLDVSAPSLAQRKNSKTEISKSIDYLWIVFPFVLIGSFLLFFFKYRKRKTPVYVQVIHKTNPGYAKKAVSLDFSDLSDKQACFEIQLILSQLFKENIELSLEQRQEIKSIQKDCELMIYSDMGSEGKKEELKKQLVILLEQLGRET